MDAKQLTLELAQAVPRRSMDAIVLRLCDCGAPIVSMKDGSQICEKTADKYEATYGKRIKV
jgi:hypothetical protein